MARTYTYHNSALTATSASLETVLKSIKSAKQTPVGEPPIGWITFGSHVDDIFGVAANQRSIDYIDGALSMHAAMKWTGWQKVLGAASHIDDVAGTIYFDAIPIVEAAAAYHLKGQAIIAPKHPYPMAVRDIAAGESPAEESPERPAYDQMQIDCRSLLGLFIWLERIYLLQLPMATNSLCRMMAYPSYVVYKYAKHILMHLVANPMHVMMRRSPTGNLEIAQPTIAPFTSGKMEYGLHMFADSDVLHTGGVIMLAGAAISTTSTRQHMAAPDPYTAEVVAAGTMLHELIPIRGWLREQRVVQAVPTPYYIDSLGCVRVATNEASCKKSVWVRRRLRVLNDGHKHGDAEYIQIDEADNVSDGYSKPIKAAVFKRHVTYLSGNWPPAE